MRGSVAGAIGAAIGFSIGLLSANTLFAHSWTALPFWGIVGVGVGAAFPKYERRRLQAAHTAGILYGLFLSAAFLLFGFHGAPSEFPRFMVVVVILSVVGAACGVFLGMIGQKVRGLAHSA